MAVSFQSAGLAWTASTIFLAKPSNRSSFDEAGWPSTSPLGLTNETAGSVPLAMSEYRFSGVLDVRVRIAAFVMIDVSYWNGLQMLQYSSVVGADRAVVQLVRIGDVVVPLSP